MWLLTAFSQLYAALTNELGKECVCSPREVKLLPRLKHWSCQAAQSRASHQLKHPRVGRALLREGSSPAGEGELHDARLPSEAHTLQQCPALGRGGSRSLLGQLPLEGCRGFIPWPLCHFFFVGSGQTSTRRLGKGLSRIFCIQLSWDMCPKFNFVVLSIPMGWS